MKSASYSNLLTEKKEIVDRVRFIQCDEFNTMTAMSPDGFIDYTLYYRLSMKIQQNSLGGLIMQHTAGKLAEEMAIWSLGQS